MFYLIMGVIVVGVIISTVIEEGDGLTKFTVCALIAALACLLLLWITDMEVMLTAAKVCGAVTVLSLLLKIILAIFG